MLNKKLNFNIYFPMCSIFYLFLCFYVKNLVLHYEKSNITLSCGVFDIVHLKNTGAAFSIFKGGNYFLAIFAILTLFLILFYIVKNFKSLKYIEVQAYSFLIAGISSNVLERLSDGYVTDYIKLNFIDFPVFNLADVFINVGAFLLLITLLFLEKEGKKNE